MQKLSARLRVAAENNGWIAALVSIVYWPSLLAVVTALVVLSIVVSGGGKNMLVLCIGIAVAFIALLVGAYKFVVWAD